MRLWRENKKKIVIKNNRINLIIAIVFLLGSLTVYKLFDIQVREYDLYSAKASNQHESFNELKQSRGKIYINNDKKITDDMKELYPFATDKDFALVYAVPEDIDQAEEVAEKLYIIFNKEETEEKVDEFFKKQEEEKLKEELVFLATLGLSEEDRINKENEVKKRYENYKYDKDYQELYKIKRETELKIQKDLIIDDYLKKLKKKNDPYEPMENKVDEETLIKLLALLTGEESNQLELKEGKIYKIAENDVKEVVKFKGISYTMVTHRYYPEGDVGSHVLGFVGMSDNEFVGKYGLEGFFNEELSGQLGLVKAERGADRNIVIVNDREYIKPINGSDLVLTINRSVQFVVCQKLNESAQKHGADSGNVIIMEPNSGAIIAMCSWPNFDPNNYEEVEDIKIFNNPVIFEQYEPGSIFKAITMAAALDQGSITPETTYNDKGQVKIQDWTIKNSDYDTFGGHGEASMNTVLELSLNTGAIFAMQQTGIENFAAYVKNFGFGEKTGIELEAESFGNINNLLKNKIQEIYAATASYGQGISVTPLQMITAYAAIANNGILMKPYIVQEIIHNDGSKDITRPIQIRRVISEKAATLLLGMLVNVVESGHAKNAGVKGYWIGGKTGTAEVASTVARGYSGRTIHTFIGIAPIDEPKFVMLVKLNDPKDVQFAVSSAAPLFSEIAEFLLQYYQVPKERK